jgi:hypothetical protein
MRALFTRVITDYSHYSALALAFWAHNLQVAVPYLLLDYQIPEVLGLRHRAQKGKGRNKAKGKAAAGPSARTGCVGVGRKQTSVVSCYLAVEHVVV